ncbi:MAG: hypothetical protein MUO22_05630, partial [Sedimentisphaerales bacterium]|nr:hypothetical protein [Sedimentisphaerales bacterium]
NSDETTIDDSYSYDAYGVMLGTDDTAAENADTSLLYAGEQYDSELDHYYLRARYYNPWSGTFNRSDPFAGNNSDPQSLLKQYSEKCYPCRQHKVLPIYRLTHYSKNKISPGRVSSTVCTMGLMRIFRV